MTELESVKRSLELANLLVVSLQSQLTSAKTRIGELEGELSKYRVKDIDVLSWIFTASVSPERSGWHDVRTSDDEQKTMYWDSKSCWWYEESINLKDPTKDFISYWRKHASR